MIGKKMRLLRAEKLQMRPPLFLLCCRIIYSLSETSGTKENPGYSVSSKDPSYFLRQSQMDDLIGATILPSILICSFQTDGILYAEAEAKILSKGTSFGYPFEPSPQINSAISRLTKLYFATFLSPNSFNSGILSMAITLPPEPTISASKAVVHPEPDPMSKILCSSAGRSNSSIKATTRG